MSTYSQDRAGVKVIFWKIKRDVDLVFDYLDVDVVKDGSVLGDFFAIRCGNVSGWN